MKRLYSEEYETWTEEANIVSYEFSTLVKSFIEEKMKEYSSVDLENVLQAELSMIFSMLRMERNNILYKQKYKDSLVEALEIEHYLLSRDKEKYLDILKNKTIIDRMTEAGITEESSLDKIYETKHKDVHKGILLAKQAYQIFININIV